MKQTFTSVATSKKNKQYRNMLLLQHRQNNKILKEKTKEIV